MKLPDSQHCRGAHVNYPGMPAHLKILTGSELDEFSLLVGPAKIVALGESRHDTREQFEAKALLARTLIQDLGFRVIIL